MLCLVGIPIGIGATSPVRAIGVDVFAADDVQLVSLEVVGSGNDNCRTVDFGHRGLQLHNSGSIGHYRAGTKATEGQPADTVLVDGHAWVEIGVGTLCICSWCIVSDHQFLVRRLPRTCGRGGPQHADTVTGVAEVKEELVLASFCIGAPRY